MSVTALIAEDEGPQRRALARLLATTWPELRIVAECADGASALAALEEKQPTVAFLDIRMAEKSGLEVAERAGENTHVVFTTAYDQHAVRAFELGAIDYILKPVTADRLARALQRVRARLTQGSQNNGSGTSSTMVAPVDHDAEQLAWITAAIGNGVKLISVGSVAFFQACERHTRVVTCEEEAIIRMPLRDLLRRLDGEEFWQVHRSYIVRLGAIKSVQRNELGRLEIALHGYDELLPVSQPFQHRFRGM